MSPIMAELNATARGAGIVIMKNRSDPGINRLFAIQTIHEVHTNGGKVGIDSQYVGHGLTGYSSSPILRGSILTVEDCPPDGEASLGNLLDSLCVQPEALMKYEPGERDPFIVVE